MIGSLVIVYTVSGWTKAVNFTQKYQMGVILIGLVIVLFTIFNLLPNDIDFNKAIKIASANSKMDVLNFSFDQSNYGAMQKGILYHLLVLKLIFLLHYHCCQNR